MKTLADHQLIYDEDCPMCRVYSGAFIKSQMLDKNGRQNFRDLSLETKSYLNVARAKNEIALVNFKDKKVHYGLDSLLVIIGNSFPYLEKIGRISFVFWFFQKLYSLVSYNRKQIIPSKNDYIENACVPDFNLKYRMLFLFIGTVFSAFLLSSISVKFNLEVNFTSAFVLILALFSFQIGSIMKSGFKMIFDYLGNLNTIIIGSSLILFIFSWLNLPEFIDQIFAIIVLILFMAEYFRRIKILKCRF